MQLSGGLYSYNRFDAYEEALKEGSGASDPKKMKKAVEKASKRAKGRGVYLDREDEKEEGKEEVSTAEGGDGGGMSEEYKDITKPSKLSGVSPQMKADARASRLQVSEPGSKREKMQTRRSGQLNKLVHSGANMARRNEEVESFFIEDEEGNIYEGKKDACYHKVKSRYDVWPSAYASGALVKCRRAGAKNWGNSSKKESVFMDDLLQHEYVISEESVRDRNKRVANEKRAANKKAEEEGRGEVSQEKSQEIKDAEARQKEIEAAKPEKKTTRRIRTAHKPAAQRDARGNAGGGGTPSQGAAGGAVGGVEAFTGGTQGGKGAEPPKRRNSRGEGVNEGTVTPAADLAQRKLNKDENNSKLKVTKKIMENDQRMAMYSRALGVMGAHYNGFAPVAPVEKKEEEAVVEASKPDYLDFDKDGDKKEPMKKALKEKGEVKKEDVELTKEMVVEYLVNEGYASNEVSAEILHTHMSDEFLEQIEDRMTGVEEEG